jgi:hypothetical protein
MSITVFILDYQRFPNIQRKILPSLLQEGCISQIVICHGSYHYDSIGDKRFPRLQEGEIQTFTIGHTQIIRIQDPLNDTYECFRRWIWIEKLHKEKKLLNSLIFTHDDDIFFAPGEINKILQAWIQQKGLCICGDGGRNYKENLYTMDKINGSCSIAIGQSMLLSVSSVLDVCRHVEQMKIPLEILYEDDIVVSLLLGGGKPLHYGLSTRKYMLPSPNARWRRSNHLEQRNRSAAWILRYLEDASSISSSPPHLHSEATTADTPPTLLTIEPLPLSQ